MSLTLLCGCSSSDYIAGTFRSSEAAPVSARPGLASAAGTAEASPLIHEPETVATTGADGYPNVNVDTARRLGGPVRSATDQDRLEAELLALGARQRAGTDGSTPSSVIGELKELGRSSKSDAEKLIESGAAPAGSD